MNCRDFRERVVEVVRTDGLKENRALFDHARLCPACSELMLQEQRVQEALGLLRHRLLSEQPPANVEQNLLGALRACSKAPATPNAVPHRWSGVLSSMRAWPSLRLAAIAAGVLVLLLLVREANDHRQGSPGLQLPPGNVEERTSTATGREGQIPGEAAPLGSPTDVIEPAAASPDSAQPVTAPPRRRSRKPRPAPPQMAATPSPTAEQPSQTRLEDEVFLPTMFVGEMGGPVELQLIRVELPRRAMRSFGLSINPYELDRPVKADLLVGPDGLTRGIRFVNDRK